MKLKYTAVVLSAAIVTGCADKPDVARHTIEEYRADKALRRDAFKKCTNDPGTLRESADCINAIEAERLESRGSLRDAKPVGLNADKNP
jgi:hypothetical protein